MRATDPLSRWEWADRPHGAVATGAMITRWQARRISRSIAEVGVAISPARLRRIAAGAAVSDEEFIDLNFALVATRILREQRRARFDRGRRVSIRFLLIAGLVLVTLNFLICMAFAMLSVIGPESPF